MSIKLVFGEVRFSYCHVWEPYKMPGKEKPEYSVSILIPKENKEMIEKVKKAIQEAKQESLYTKFGGKMPAELYTPLHDGDKERADDPAYAGMYYLNAKCRTKPGIIDRYKQPITDSTEFYSGCYGYVSVSFYPYDTAGKKGITCGLNNLMKTRDGENLGGRSKAEDDFADINLEDNDFYDF